MEEKRVKKVQRHQIFTYRKKYNQKEAKWKNFMENIFKLKGKEN